MVDASSTRSRLDWITTLGSRYVFLTLCPWSRCEFKVGTVSDKLWALVSKARHVPCLTSPLRLWLNRGRLLEFRKGTLWFTDSMFRVYLAWYDTETYITNLGLICQHLGLLSCCTLWEQTRRTYIGLRKQRQVIRVVNGKVHILRVYTRTGLLLRDKQALIPVQRCHSLRLSVMCCTSMLGCISPLGCIPWSLKVMKACSPFKG